jgi:hypothetical protein
MALPSQCYDVFLCHNSRDKALVRELANVLKSRAQRVFFDEWELVPGRPWQEALEAAIDQVKSAAVLYGASGIGPWADYEIRAFLEEFARRKLPVIPVLLPGAGEEPQLPLFLRRFTWVDLRSGLSREGIDKLLWGITGERPELLEAGASEDPGRSKLSNVPPLPSQYQPRAETETLRRDLLSTQPREPATPPPQSMERTARVDVEDPRPPEPTQQKPQRRQSPLMKWIAGGVALLVIGAAIVVVPRLGGSAAAPVASTTPSATPQPAPIQPPTPAQAPTSAAATPEPSPTVEKAPKAPSPDPKAAVASTARKPPPSKPDNSKATKPQPAAAVTPSGPTGTLNVGCSTQVCYIFIDGKDIDRETPAFNIPLTVGRHTVKVVGAESGAQQVNDVEIVEKQQAKAIFNL